MQQETPPMNGITTHKIDLLFRYPYLNFENYPLFVLIPAFVGLFLSWVMVFIVGCYDAIARKFLTIRVQSTQRFK